MKNRRECEELVARILEHLDGELGDVDCRTLEEHLAACPDCAACRDILEKSRSLCSRRRELPAGARERILSALRRKAGGGDSR